MTNEYNEFEGEEQDAWHFILDELPLLMERPTSPKIYPLLARAQAGVFFLEPHNQFLRTPTPEETLCFIAQDMAGRNQQIAPEEDV